MITVPVDNSPQPLDRHADSCPHCHHSILPRMLQATLNGRVDARGTLLDIAYKCPRHECARMFIGTFRRKKTQGDKMVGGFYFVESFPICFIPPSVADEVKGISPTFQIIYAQAVAAESSQLDQIAGVGYRKSLEFLVKDYCISRNPSALEDIKSSFLGKVIDKYVDDPNISACAKRAAWLGNDESHYTRKWEDKDISDLKILIELTTGWIRNNVLTSRYMSEMI